MTPITRGLRRATIAEWAVLSLLLTLAAGLLGWQSGLGRVDQTLYDAALRILAPQPSEDIVIIAIDEPSLDALGRWPWSRTVHAELLEKLIPARPKAIGVDLILAEPESGGADEQLAKAISASAPVVLPVLMEQDGKGSIRTTLPTASIAARASGLGHIHVEVDSDGMARSLFLLEGLVEADPTKSASWPHISIRMLEAGERASRLKSLPGTRNPSTNSPVGVWRRDFWIQLLFSGPPGSYRRVSYIDVLQGKVPAETFQNKYVLIGATATGLGDAYATPVSGEGRAMPGVEVNATALDNLMQERTLVRLSPWANATLSVLFVAVCMLALRRLSPRGGLAFTGAALLAVLLFSLLALGAGRTWFSPAACLFCIAVAYPLWSWRRLEATLTFLGSEFQRIDAEPDILPRSTSAPSRGTDIVEERIAALESAATRLRDTRRFVADTLNEHPDGIVVSSLNGKVLLVNRAAVQFLGADDPTSLIGLHIDEAMQKYAAVPLPASSLPWHAGQASSVTDDSSAAGRNRPEPTVPEFVTKAGRTVAVHSADGANAGGTRLGWIVSLIDVTALRSAEAARDDALAFLSHDMRSPQTSILALLELHALDPEAHTKESTHARIDSYVRKTLTLSDQFLQVSSAETKQYQLEEVDISEICLAALDDIWDLAGKKAINLVQRFDAPSATVLADRALLVRALSNVLSNAIKYSPDKSQVVLMTSIRGNELQIDVIDQGVGMSPEDQTQLFIRYRRHAAPGQGKVAGAGLGLVFVKTVVERHAGRIAIQSASGHGTTVSILLQLSQQAL